MPPASETDWNNLSLLRVGARIVVETMDNIRHYGKFVAYSDEAISLREGKCEVGYRRENVVQVSLLGPPKRRKAALVGLAIGFAGGAIISAAKWAGQADLSEIGKAILILGTGGVFGGIGAGVGAAVAPRPKTVIYRVGP